MPIEVTQEDRERLLEICALWSLGRKEGALNEVAIHRQAAYAKGEVAGIKLRDDYYNKVRERNAK